MRLLIAITAISAVLPSVFASQSRRASSGCGRQSPWSFDGNQHSNVTLGSRSFLVHIPSNYSPNAAHAVVLSFHGYGRNDKNQETISGFSNQGVTINGKGIIAVYPLAAYGPGKSGDGLKRAWQGAPYSPNVDDIRFTKNILDAVQQNLCVDSSRIYASGKSNGGGFVNLLACTPSISSRFAAFASVSAALYPGTHPIDGCNAGSDTNLINFHGTADATIPYNGRADDGNGDTAYATPNIGQYRKAWAKRMGCTSSDGNGPSPNDVETPYDSTTEYNWYCPQGNLKGFRIDGLGHSWPTTQGLDTSGNPNAVASFDATPAEIIPFFESYTL